MKIFDFILNILFPPRCVSCKKEGDFLCEACIAQLKIKDLRLMKRYDASEKEFDYLDGVIYGLDYADNPQIQAALKQFKYKFTQDLADYFGDIVAQKVEELSMTRGKKVILIPVPLHKKRLNYRGFNQAELIANAVSDRVGDRAEVISALIRTRHTSQQAKLHKKDRQKNLEDAFQVVGNFDDTFKNVVYFLVDDVCTTGSTLENCAKALKDAGLPRVYGLTVARAFK